MLQNRVVALSAFLFVVLVSGQDVPVVIQPKLIAHQESIKANAGVPESTVTITVGEENGFKYTVNGETTSIYKISVSGEYLNDEIYPARGYARLFLVVDTGVAYYALRPSGNILDVYVQNRFGDEFIFEILCPFPVRGYDLWEGQINATAVLVTGPSRSQIRGQGYEGKRGLKLTRVAESEGEEVKDRRRRRNAGV